MVPAVIRGAAPAPVPGNKKSGPCRATADIAGTAAGVRSNQPQSYASPAAPDRFPGPIQDGGRGAAGLAVQADRPGLGMGGARRTVDGGMWRISRRPDSTMSQAIGCADGPVIGLGDGVCGFW
jgi:hypothetical protein